MIIMKKGELKDIINDVISCKADLPDDAVIIDEDMLPKLFTKRRIELISLINRHHPRSIQEIAGISGRMKQAVHRDLKILEGIGVIKLEKHGQNMMPIIEDDVISVPLRSIGYMYSKKKLIVADKPFTCGKHHGSR